MNAASRKRTPEHRAEMNARRLRRIRRSVHSRKAGEQRMAEEAIERRRRWVRRRRRQFSNRPPVGFHQGQRT